MWGCAFESRDTFARDHDSYQLLFLYSDTPWTIVRDTSDNYVCLKTAHDMAQLMALPTTGRTTLAPLEGGQFDYAQAPPGNSRLGNRISGEGPRLNPSANGARDGVLRKSGSQGLPSAQEALAPAMSIGGGVISNVSDSYDEGLRQAALHVVLRRGARLLHAMHIAQCSVHGTRLGHVSIPHATVRLFAAE